MSTFKLSNGTLRYLGAMLFFAAFAKPAMAADVTGTWTMTVMTDQGSGMMSVVLQQQGSDLTGSISGDAGNAPVNGKVDDTAVSFSHDLPDYGISASYRGTVENNTIKGTVDFGGGAAMGTFSAERQE
ncbi:MAG: hypothetical protein R3F41_12720 [Gammaproteobacteria bacterium]|nr:hypothetical protein [Pseudomonadales bacterium]MCP5348961.1 hypothetical protein [Pseudomonadales bacterium]